MPETRIEYIDFCINTKQSRFLNLNSTKVKIMKPFIGLSSSVVFAVVVSNKI